MAAVLMLAIATTIQHSNEYLMGGVCSVFALNFGQSKFIRTILIPYVHCTHQIYRLVSIFIVFG